MLDISTFSMFLHILVLPSLASCSNKQIFNSVKPEYEEALKKSRYQASLEYVEPKGHNMKITPTIIVDRRFSNLVKFNLKFLKLRQT